MLNYENKTEQIELRPASNEEAGLFYARPSAQDDAPRSNQYALTGHDDGSLLIKSQAPIEEKFQSGHE